MSDRVADRTPALGLFRLDDSSLVGFLSRKSPTRGGAWEIASILISLGLSPSDDLTPDERTFLQS